MHAHVNVVEDVSTISDYHDWCCPPCYVLLYIAGEKMNYFSTCQFLKDFIDYGCEWFLREILMPVVISQPRIKTYLANFVYTDVLDAEDQRHVQNEEDRKRVACFTEYIFKNNFTLKAISHQWVHTHLLAGHLSDNLFTKVGWLVKQQMIPVLLGEYLLYGHRLDDKVSDMKYIEYSPEGVLHAS